MSFANSPAPWQVGTVSPFGRVAAAALAAIAVDAVSLWNLAPNAAVALATVAAPLIVAIRVARGFERSLPIAMVTFVMFGAAIATLMLRGTMSSALGVGALLASVGFVAAAAAWLEQRRRNKPAVIELTRSTSRDPFARVHNRDR